MFSLLIINVNTVPRELTFINKKKHLYIKHSITCVHFSVFYTYVHKHSAKPSTKFVLQKGTLVFFPLVFFLTKSVQITP